MPCIEASPSSLCIAKDFYSYASPMACYTLYPTAVLTAADARIQNCYPWEANSQGFAARLTTACTCRFQFGKGFPGCTPTPWTTPAADYASARAFGPQALSRCTTAPSPTVPKAPRAAAQRQFVSRAHERERYCTESPGPTQYDGVRGRGALGVQMQSRSATAPTFGFGSGSRFSQTAPQRRPRSRAAAWGWSMTPETTTEAHFCSPGPGKYRVQ